MTLPESPNIISFREAAKLADRFFHLGKQSLSENEKYLLACAALVTKTEDLLRFPGNSRDRVERIQAAAEDMDIKISDAPFKDFAMSFEADDVQPTLKFWGYFKLRKSIENGERWIFRTAAHLLLSPEYREHFLGDMHELKNELRDEYSGWSLRRRVWHQAVICLWPAVKWRTRQLTERFLRLIGVMKAFEWIAGKL